MPNQNILQIVQEPHPVLRQKARDINASDITSKKIQDLIMAMKRTLASTPDGVGLAAPQVGEGLRLFIISDEAEEIDRLKSEKNNLKNNQSIEDKKPYPVREWHYYVFINPDVTGRSRRKLDGHEGCLSVPDVFGNIKRCEKITIQAYNEHGKKFIRGASRFFARVMQHEFDHLNGTLFIDSANDLIDTKKERKVK
ncbi:MAG: peptide deformylase [Patescibacteria group bacterium]